MSADRSTQPWRSLTWWFRDPRTGEIVLFQRPNVPMVVAQAAAGVQQLGILRGRERELGLVRTGALMVWAALELARGTTPFRRVLGAGTIAWQLRRIAR